MTTPAHDQIGTSLVIENASVAQDVIDGVGDRVRFVHVEPVVAEDRIVDVDDVAQHREQVFLHAAKHLPVDERTRRRVANFELDPPGLTAQADVEILVAIEDVADVIGLQAR